MAAVADAADEEEEEEEEEVKKSARRAQARAGGKPASFWSVRAAHRME